MSEFSQYLINQLQILLNPEYNTLFIEDIYPQNKKKFYSDNFQDFINDVLNSDFKNRTSKEDLQEIKNNITRNKNKKKKNWLKVFETDYKSLQTPNPSTSTLLYEFKTYEMMQIDELKRAFGVNSAKELIDLRYAEVKSWEKDKNSKLVDFRYFKDKKPNQKLTAFRDDLVLEIIDISNKHFNGSLNDFLTQRATDLIDNPIFGINKMLLQMDTAIDETSNSPVLFNDYYVSEDYILRTLIREPENVKVKECYILDERDSEIIDMIYSKIRPNFYRDKTIEIDIGEITKRIYPTSNGYAYKDAENRIMKISMYQIQGLIKEKDDIKDTKFNINFFDHVVIETDPISKKRIAKIVFGEILHSRYIHNKTVKIASYQYKQMDSFLSKMLFFTLQKERLEKSVTQNIGFYFGEYDYMFFRHKIRFRSRKKAENMKLIEESLNEFKDKEFLIRNFKRNIDSFLIEFYPLTKEEKEDFGINTDKKEQLRIEGF